MKKMLKVYAKKLKEGDGKIILMSVIYCKYSSNSNQLINHSFAFEGSSIGFDSVDIILFTQ